MPGETTLHIQACLMRLQAGDATALDELLERAMQRLKHMASKIFGDFSGLKRWVGSDDVLQNATIRLQRALAATPPESPLHFFRLAAAQIRRELKDLARHYHGPEGAGENEASQAEDAPAPAAQGQSTLDPARLAEWTELHDKIATLPDEEREVFELLWYHGLSQQEAADLLGTSLRTVKRRWQRARMLLHAYLEPGAGHDPRTGSQD
jgi:RNA polymerase sigma-70 factor (ECF subfamily)